MAKVLGLVNLHADVSYSGLTERRPVASVSFLGRYGIIDVVLSNMSNSGIDRVGVLIKEKPRSLLKHLGSGDSWDFNEKSGGVSLLYNEQYANNPNYNNDINNLEENIAFLESYDSDYVVIAPAHVISIIDYDDVVEAHKKSDAPVTVVYSKIKDGNESFIGADVLDIKDGELVGVKPNKGSRKDVAVSLETYVVDTKELVTIMKKAKRVSSFLNFKEALTYLLDEIHVNTYQYRGYVRCIDSIESYFKYSLEFLDQSVASTVFKSNWPIYTKTNDTPPTKYLKNSKVKKSFVANGSFIDGTVENSIIGRDVEIGKDAVVKNCIIFTGAKVAAGAVLENVIMDKKSEVKVVTELSGTSESPLFMKEGDVV